MNKFTFAAGGFLFGWLTRTILVRRQWADIHSQLEDTLQSLYEARDEETGEIDFTEYLHAGLDTQVEGTDI